MGKAPRGPGTKDPRYWVLTAPEDAERSIFYDMGSADYVGILIYARGEEPPSGS